MRVLLLLLAVAALPGCGSLGPSDEPLPSFEELIAEFGIPEPGTGVVREQGGASGAARYATTAFYYTTGQEYGEPSLTQFNVDLRGVSYGGIAVSAEGVTQEAIRERMERGVSVFGRGGNRGGGRLQITSIEGEAISGVFVADLIPSGLYPDFPRVSGAFTALPDTTQ